MANWLPDLDDDELMKVWNKSQEILESMAHKFTFGQAMYVLLLTIGRMCKLHAPHTATSELIDERAIEWGRETQDPNSPNGILQ